MVQSQYSHEHLFKVLVLGETSTGKTSFIKRYVHNFFSRAYKATIGVDFALKTIQYDENTSVRLQLWDIAGQERFGAMTKIYYRDAYGAFLVFDVNRPKTFESVMRWKIDLDTKVSLSDGSNIPCLLLANKCDLVQGTEEEERMLKEFAKEKGFIGCLYTSPKDNINIEEAARMLVGEILRRQQNLVQDDLDKHDTIVMTSNVNRRSRNDQKEGSSCC